MANTKTVKTILRSIYDACLGVTSECDAFANFYKGGSETLLSDFERALKELGIKTPISISRGNTTEEKIKSTIRAIRSILEIKGQIVSDYPDENYGGSLKCGFVLYNLYSYNVKIKCPLGFQDWTDLNVGFIIETTIPNQKLNDISPVVDELACIFEPLGLVRPTVKLDPGPGQNKSAWFVRFKISN